METPNSDQDRSRTSFRNSVPQHQDQPAHESRPARFIPTEDLHFDRLERVIASSYRVPIVVLHPNEIFRLGIHHTWSTSDFVAVKAVAANWGELGLNSDIASIRVGVVELSALGAKGGSVQPWIDAQVSELASLVSSNPQIRWIVLADSLPHGYHQTLADAGASGVVEGDFTAERLESAILWVDTGRCVGLEEPNNSLASTIPTNTSDTKTKSFAMNQSSGHLEAQASKSIKELSERERQVLDGLVEGSR